MTPVELEELLRITLSQPKTIALPVDNMKNYSLDERREHKSCTQQLPTNLLFVMRFKLITATIAEEVKKHF